MNKSTEGAGACGCGDCGCDDIHSNESFIDFLTGMGMGMRPATLVDLLPPKDPNMIEQFPDGHYEIECTGFGPDDLDTTVTDELATFKFETEDDQLEFAIVLPKNVTDINLTIDKGVMHLSLAFKPCDINVNFI